MGGRGYDVERERERDKHTDLDIKRKEMGSFPSAIMTPASKSLL